jgi:5-methylcytosine-specific restriction protein A
MICGPPGSGKSTYAKSQNKPGDVIIDLDEIISQVSGMPLYQAGDEWVGPGLHRRNKILAGLSERTSGRAFFIISTPRSRERSRWKELLSVAETVILETPSAICKERINADQRRGNAKGRHCEVIQDWWMEYDRCPGEIIMREELFE